MKLSNKCIGMLTHFTFRILHCMLQKGIETKRFCRTFLMIRFIAIADKFHEVISSFLCFRRSRVPQADLLELDGLHKTFLLSH